MQTAAQVRAYRDRRWRCPAGRALLAFLVCFCFAQTTRPASLYAQAVDRFDEIEAVQFHEALLLLAQGDETKNGRPSPPGVREPYYTDAVQALSKLVERNPDEQSPENQRARRFRIIADGRLANLKQQDRLISMGTAEARKEALDLLDSPDRLQAMRDRLAVLSAEMPPGEVTGEADAAGRLRDAESRYLSRLLESVAAAQKSGRESVQSLRDADLQAAAELARDEADLYHRMLDDLGILLGSDDDPVFVLLQAVVLSKLARLSEQYPQKIQDAEPPAARNRLAAELLSSLRDRLREEELDNSLKKALGVRVRYYLGVIRYRQAVPSQGRERAAELALTAQQQAYLLDAEQIMRDLAAGGESVDLEWRVLANLYLGIIVPVKVVDTANELPAGKRAEDLLRDARDRLGQSLDLDTGRSAEDQLPSLPGIIFRQQAQIEKLQVARRVPAKINDIRVTLDFGSRYDSNVILLGERTDLPRGIDDEGDFSLTAGQRIDYTVDFADRWTMAVRAQAGQIWQYDVSTFDQHNYGTSLGLRYRFLDEDNVLGPGYLGVQYDYDFTLLGRNALLSNHSFLPSVRLYWDEQRALTDLFARFESRNYFEALRDTRFNRDGDYFTFGVLQSYKLSDLSEFYENRGLENWGLGSDQTFSQEDPDFPKRWLSAFVGLTHAWDATEGEEFDRQAWSLLGGLNIPLPWGLDFKGSALLEWEDYLNPSLNDFHRRARRDFVQEYRLSLSRTFVLAEGQQAHRFDPSFDRTLMTVQAFASFTDDDSNTVNRRGEAVYEFDRAMYGFVFSFSFN